MTNGNDVFVYNDQNQFLQHYFQDEDESKIITTYTNAITNEYNQYIRSLAVTNQIPGTKLDIVCNGDSYLEDKGKEGILSYITDWADYREFYPGEKIIIGEVNQNGGNIIHQNGETITINRVEILEHTEFVTMPSLDLMAQPTTQEIKFQFYKITDTNAKVVNVVPKESFPAYQDCIQLLKQEAENNQGAKARWKRFYTFKEKFTNVNTMFAATLYKLQGSTYHDLYADIRDLDKFFKWNPVIVYKLLYVAFTRPKKKGIILI